MSPQKQKVQCTYYITFLREPSSVRQGRNCFISLSLHFTEEKQASQHQISAHGTYYSYDLHAKVLPKILTTVFVLLLIMYMYV